MRTKLLLFPLLLLLLGATAAHAQTPTLVADIVPGTDSSLPSQSIVFNNKLYFAANTPASGIELWVYDGVNAPSLVYDLNPGSADGLSYGGPKGLGLAILNNKLYFCGQNASSGYELFSYDGTNPPVLVTNLEAGNGDSYLTPYMVFNNKLVCAGITTTNGYELYLYDGVNTPVLYDVVSGIGSSDPSNFCAFNGRFYFSAYNSTGAIGLYGYDPATNAVTLTAPVGNPAYMAVLGSKMYFRAATVANGYELFSYDGANIALTNDLTSGSGNGVANFTPIAPYNGKIYMSGSTDGANYQLYAYDPSNGNTTLVYAMNTIGSSSPYPFAVYHGKLYVGAYTPTAGSELWSTDGTTTTMLPEIAPGTASGGFNPFSPLFTEYNGSLYFCAGNAATTGSELYKLTTPTSVQSVLFDGSVKVYPNPAMHNASLELELQSARTLSVSLTDVLGRKVYESAQVSCPVGKTVLSIPMETLAPSVYLYRVMDAKEGLLQSGQISKQ